MEPSFEDMNDQQRFGALTVLSWLIGQMMQFDASELGEEHALAMSLGHHRAEELVIECHNALARYLMPTP